MKKRILLSALPLAAISLFAQQASAQSGYTVSGKLSNLNTKYIYLGYKDGDKTLIDSTVTDNGSFSFKGNVASPLQATISVVPLSGGHISRSQVFSIYLENSNIQVSGNADSLSLVKITGSKSQDVLNEYAASLKDLETKGNELNKKYGEAAQKNDTATQKEIVKEFNGLEKEQDSKTKTFIAQHPNSVVSADLLQQIAYGKDYNDLAPLYNAFSDEVKNTASGQKNKKMLDIMAKTAIGKPALPITQNDVNGKPVNLSDFKGKYVLIDFWASWCGPCRAENPNVVKAYNKYKDKNFTIFGVSLDQSGDNWKEAIAKDNLTWTEVSDLQYWKNAAAADYGVQAIPANFLIDPNGVIIGHDLRGEDLENKLAEILK
ncbi:MAG TPA: TlpA disulfide reductase family protein [Arachidicoccus sp.]